jgi:hypothetical protein
MVQRNIHKRIGGRERGSREGYQSCYCYYCQILLHNIFTPLNFVLPALTRAGDVISAVTEELIAGG